MPKDFTKDTTIKDGGRLKESTKAAADDFVKTTFFSEAASKVKTGAKVSSDAFLTGVRTGRRHSAEAIARYAPDIYDQHQDLSTGSTKSLLGLGVQNTRSVLRVKRSIQNRFHFRKAVNLEFKSMQIKDKLKEADALAKTGLNVSSQKEQLTKDLMNLGVQKEKQFSMVNKHNGVNMKLSAKRSISSQGRKAINSISHKDDMGSKVIGKSVSSAYHIKRNAKTIKAVGRMLTGAISSIISALLSFIVSIPSMIAAIVAFLPALIIFIAIIAILLPNIDLTVSGRVSVLADNVYVLNELYDVNIEPEYVLAISNELKWTNGDIKDYERLYSLMLDQKKGVTPSFDKMMDNVFSKYNPVNTFNEGLYNEESITPYIFYSNTGFNVIGTSYQKIKFKELIALYPDFKEDKKTYKENYNLETIKKHCKDSLKYNQEMYLKYMSSLGGFAAGKSETGNKIAKQALTCLNCLYYWGGSGEIKTSNTQPVKLDKIFDCSGLVYWAHKETGVQIGRSTANMYGKMGKKLNYDQLQAGDIITFDWNKDGVDDHIVIYIGNGEVVGAEGKGAGTYANDFTQCVKTWKLDTKKNSISKLRRLY